MPHAGRYTIRRKIADGGMAEIFLATQHGAERFERPVVLKRILQALVADPQFRNMMIDEAHVAMSLNHSNIVQVLDLGQAKGRYFLVLELVDGWDLNQLLHRVKNTGLELPPELALYFAAEVCRALGYAHHKNRDGKPLGIVHRDVSPHNVLVSDQGEVKLTDFGIAKALGRRERTGQGIIKGKLAFMSPEQASGSVLDARSDLFSVGTMLYLMATGKRPFEAPTDLEGILRVRQCDFPPAQSAKPDIVPELAAVIAKAMMLAPSERYQSAEEMLEAIEKVQRTSFKAAGQTELKRWLADLGHRDHVPTISKAPAPQSTGEPETLDLIEGEDLVFDDSKLADASELGLAPVRPPPTPPESMPARPRRSRGRGLLWLLVIGGSAAGYFYFQRAAPVHVEEPPRLDARPKVAMAVPEPPADAAPALAIAPDAAAPDDEENALLQKAEPDAEETVIGEESAPPSSKKKASAPAPAAREEVSVRVTSRPDGAVIKIGNRVFGRAPMNLRFRSGITYDLSFVKSGYATTTKRFTVTKRKNQAVTATLKKKAATKKSFFRRLFGR